MLRRSWVEINLRQLEKNYEVYLSGLKSECDIMAVVKADAYGHGAIEISKRLQKKGVVNFAVSNLNEAIALRKEGIVGQILILGYTPLECLDELIKYDITQALISESYAQDIILLGKKIKCQYAIDTGMNRIGLNARNIEFCDNCIRTASEYLDLNGIFTHLCVADSKKVDDYRFTKHQITQFKKVVDKIDDLNLNTFHFMNSAAGMWHFDSLSSFVRLGIVLYGLKPDYNKELPEGIKPIMTWKSVVSMIKKVEAGEYIGYGRTCRLDEEKTIATISTGYADGYNRYLSNKGYVLLHGKRAPIVGRICMDQFMIDISDIPQTRAYDEVTLIGKDGNEVLTADDIAQIVGTIGYEIVCDVGKRVERVYVE